MTGADRLDRRWINISPPGTIGAAGKFENFFANPFGRIEPIVPQLIEFLGRCGNRRPLLVGRFREGKSFKAGSGRVTITAFLFAELCSQCKCPSLVDSRLKYT